MKREVSTTSIFVIPIAVGIHLVGNFIASTVKLPVFRLSWNSYWPCNGRVDCNGSGGNFIIDISETLYKPYLFPFMIVSIINAIVIGIAAKKNHFSNFKIACLHWIAIVVLSTISSSVLFLFLFLMA